MNNAHITHSTSGPLITSSVKILLETKHLYQSVKFPLPAHDSREKPFIPVLAVRDETFEWKFGHLTDSRFWVWVAPDIKIFCSNCGRVEAHNNVSSSNVIERTSPKQGGCHGVQVFVLEYRCQGCKEMPQVFMIRNSDGKLTLCGRSPMEVAAVPACLPAAVSKHFGNALVAHQSGQTLSGLFMLRVLIEQWARRFSKQDHADQAISDYMATLPEAFKSNFPSWRDMYAKLSASIHAAHADEAIFGAVRDEIVHHFEARDVFRLSGPVAIR